MIRTYSNSSGKFVLDGEHLGALDTAVWIDVLRPTPDEETALERAFGIGVPTLAEMSEIELSSRLYSEDGAHFLTANMLSRTDDDMVKVSPITFILTGDKVITVRYEEPRAIDAFVARCQKSGTYSADQILIGILEGVIERIGDLLERAGHDLDMLSEKVFFTQAPASVRNAAAAGGAKGAKSTPNARQCDFQAVLVEVGHKGDLISKIQDSLISLQRLLAFDSSLASERKPGKAIDHRIKTLAVDVQALRDHAGFLTQKINFLLDATLGMINIQQTAIIKIFSVAAVVFLPPTLIASIYGMNYKHMPELDWVYGYPIALVLMVMSAVLPYLFFKWRGWL